MRTAADAKNRGRIPNPSFDKLRMRSVENGQGAGRSFIPQGRPAGRSKLAMTALLDSLGSDPALPLLLAVEMGELGVGVAAALGRALGDGGLDPREVFRVQRECGACA